MKLEINSKSSKLRFRHSLSRIPWAKLAWDSRA